MPTTQYHGMTSVFNFFMEIKTFFFFETEEKLPDFSEHIRHT